MGNSCSETWVTLNVQGKRCGKEHRMPWQEASIVSLRQEFCAVARRPGMSMAEACRRFQISRKTGYKWLARCDAGTSDGVADRPRRPHTSPRQTNPEQEASVLALRDAHPTWGGRKLKRRLEDQGLVAPAASTITAILRRHDRLPPDDPVHHPAWHRFEHPRPNDLWQLDFKGDFAVGAGRCYPLMVLDDHSRFVLGLRACGDQRGITVRPILTELFTRYGLPWAVLCDNGGPWGTVHAEGGLTRLSAWLIRLGIRVIHGRPVHPQTQGKLERVNRTLAADVLATPRYQDLTGCQVAFDAWRDCYNRERPHQAIGMATPVTRFTLSPRPFPITQPPLSYESSDQIRKVSANGDIEFRGRRHKASKAISGECVGIRATTIHEVWDVYYAYLRIRTLDLRPSARIEDEIW